MTTALKNGLWHDVINEPASETTIVVRCGYVWWRGEAALRHVCHQDIKTTDPEGFISRQMFYAAEATSDSEPVTCLMCLTAEFPR